VKKMSVDIIIMKLPDEYNGNIDELPEDWEPEEIGTFDFFEDTMKKSFPNFETNGKLGFILIEETFALEIYLENENPITSIHVTIRKWCDEAEQAIQKICEQFQCRAFDGDQGELIC
jgi:hypothetical protein